MATVTIEPERTAGDTNLVRSRTDPNGATEFDAGGKVIRTLFDPSTPILMIGGDHPYSQWLGDATHEGTLAYYEANGIKPYIAVNTDAESGENNPGDTGMMTWAEVATIKNRVELQSHGARHIQAWSKINTGLKITYTGANATATVYCDGTNLVLTDSGATNIALSGETLTTLAAAVNAVAGWACTLAGELTGDESATNVLTIASGNAKNAKTPNIARMATGGGITIRYSGTAYRSAWVWRATNLLILHGDGVPVAWIDTTNASYDTLGELVTYINTLTGWTAYLCDNDNSVAANTDNYISGGESSANLKLARFVDCINTRAILTAGLSNHYMIRRQLLQAKAQAVANGLEFKNFSQSGGSAWPELFAAHADLHGIFRGNDQYAVQYQPGQFQLGLVRHMMPHFNIGDGEGYTSAGRPEAIIEALADSPGFALNLLVHEVNPDASTGQTFLADMHTGSLTETYWAAMVAKIKAKQDAGEIIVLTPEEARKLIPQSRAFNKLFNPRLKNSGEALTGAASDPGVIIPGWALLTPAQFTAASVTDGALSLTSNATTTQGVLKQYVYLKPGKTYRFLVHIDEITVSSGSGVQLSLARAVNKLAMDASPASTQTVYTTYATTAGVLEMLVSVPVEEVQRAYVRSLNAQTYDLSTNTNIRVNIDSKGLTANINCAGSTAAATTAKEVATAINAALAADANYPAEYHNCARAENGRVIIESPYAYSSGAPDSYQIVVDQGSANDAYSAIFGSVVQDGKSLGKNATALPDNTSWWLFAVNVALSGSVKVSGLTCEEL